MEVPIAVIMKKTVVGYRAEPLYHCQKLELDIGLSPYIRVHCPMKPILDSSVKTQLNSTTTSRVNFDICLFACPYVCT